MLWTTLKLSGVGRRAFFQGQVAMLLLTLCLASLFARADIAECHARAGRSSIRRITRLHLLHYLLRFVLSMLCQNSECHCYRCIVILQQALGVLWHDFLSTDNSENCIRSRVCSRYAGSVGLQQFIFNDLTGICISRHY